MLLRSSVRAASGIPEASEGGSRTEYNLPLPSLTLLDLKLPKLSGLEVLQWIRQQPNLVRTPVVVLTSSAEDDDIKRAYEYGANSFLQKPVAFTGLVQLLGALDLYWLQTNIGSSRTGTSN